jgi:uncharacterized protein YqgV (UPF0045/DUF77 family)
MSDISAQVSLYPLEQADVSAPIQAVWDALGRHAVVVEPGPMSTVVRGESRAVFAALEAAFASATEFGHAVMTITVSNACPVSLSDK